jgi:hypothetical protein
MSRDSAVRIATGYGLDSRKVGVLSPGRGKIFLLSTSSTPILRLSSGLKQPGRDANHTPPSSAEVKNTWICTSTPSCLHGIVLN